MATNEVMFGGLEVRERLLEEPIRLSELTQKPLTSLVQAASAANYTIEAVGMNCLYISNAYCQNKNWNPIVDDGDAFRLAIDAGISLELDASEEVGTATVSGRVEREHALGVVAWIISPADITIKVFQRYTGDKRRDTRLAIVEVAIKLATGI